MLKVVGLYLILLLIIIKCLENCDKFDLVLICVKVWIKVMIVFDFDFFMLCVEE